ncbi:MAG: hypothetical protein AAF826_03670 [Pseudomonadota bacterium]
MKKIAYFATAGLAATAAVAGGLDEPIVQAVEIVDEPTGSAAAWLIPLVAIGLVALAISDDDDS